jgi:histidinol-phosphate/aromatic aminotransferase/cobyric acid decarboxylase-like protein
VIDESFIDFAGSQSASVTDWVLANQASHVVVIKSLSKCLGAPGLRLGYCLSADTVFIAGMNERIPIWNTNSVAEYFLELLLKYRTEITASFQKTIRDRDAFSRVLAELDFLQPYPSGGNFILCRLADHGPSAAELARILLESSGIYIKDCTRKFETGHGEFVRLAVRMPDENLRLVSELKHVYSASAIAVGA